MKDRRGRDLVRFAAVLLLVGGAVWLAGQTAWAEEPVFEIPTITIDGKKVEEASEMSTFLQLMVFLTILTLAPYILVMTTAFIRIVITLSFLRTALGTQQVPPTQVLMGLSLFLTLYVMSPVGARMNTEAIQPYLAGEISQREFVQKGLAPLREFLMSQTRDKDLALFIRLGNIKVSRREDVPFHALLPAFVLSEIKTAFEIGFLLYIPFLVIDMVVASVLMSMGMFMLSPMSISLPFKLLLFVMIDGWHLVVNGLVESFNR